MCQIIVHYLTKRGTYSRLKDKVRDNEPLSGSPIHIVNVQPACKASLNHHHFPPTAIPPLRSSAIAVNCSSAACKSSTMLAASTSGEASVSAPSRLSSRSQKRSRLTLSRLSSSS